MKSRWVCVVICLVIIVSRYMTAQAVATLPPYVAPSVQAPTVNLPTRMLLPDPRITVVTQVAHGGETIGLVGETETGANALWLYDSVRGTFTLRYEAPLGYQIESLLLCQGDCYWTLWRDDSLQGWEIMVLRGETDRIERVQTDTYERSTMAPTLRTDGTCIYWYETDQPIQRVENAEELFVQLFRVRSGEAPTPMFSLQIVNDGLGPAVSEDMLAVSRYNAQPEQWSILLFSLETGEILAEYTLQNRPKDIQTAGEWMLWIEDETSEAGMGRIATLEEGDQLYAQQREWALRGRLVRLHRESGMTQVLDTDVESALLFPFGVVYSKASGLLYCYSFTLEQPIRLSASGDYLPVMAENGEELLILRKIWVGDEHLYRPIVLNLEQLKKGWPDLL